MTAFMRQDGPQAWVQSEEGVEYRSMVDHGGTDDGNVGTSAERSSLGSEDL